MASMFLRNEPDISRLPSISGYAMFVASTVYFKSLVAQRKVQLQNISRLTAALYILQNLKLYWTTLQKLVIIIAVVTLHLMNPR